MIGILDYGAGNLRSVQNTLDEIGAEYRLIHSAAEVREAAKIVLPGVGHFGQMMRALDRMQVREPLAEQVRAGVPFLGICLGLQALFESSEEAPELQGLGILPGTVRRFSGEARVPHMGWNHLAARRESKLLSNLGAAPYVYFAHSYYAPVVDETAATCTYTVPYSAVIDAGSLCGVQFHPEKSGDAGLHVLRNFLAVPGC